MPPICIAYFSGSRRTEAMAREIRTGTGQECRMIDVAQVGPEDWQALAAAPGIVFGSPTYMGGVAGAVAQFFEDASRYWDNGDWADKIAGGFTTSMHPSGDKLSTLLRMAVFAAQMQMVWIGQGEISAPINPENAGINRDGAWLGLMATDPCDGTLLTEGDLETARRFGARIAMACARWHG
ncbi:flavodoxin family protein [Aquicoccus sp. G2-2]|uniref:flavodoxin family protein n=1 Tax=Aquicoccus sp. G2-2 TaxID=3092120 RepID=UPI002AE06F20|nr:NAD(P)H-dependent oxidoreductase [Aquicoccus sp. G2-2]MEA1114363.1 NAD(P)H-dependent oxidoreductase [Aquicoccus sp. G2-2]